MKLVIARTIFLVIFIFSGCSTYTEVENALSQKPINPHNWQKVGKEKENTLYVDIENIKIDNGFVYYWELIDFKEAIYGALSRISKFKVNCDDQEKANLDVISYTGQMGKYIIINEGRYSGTDFFDASLSITMKFACDYVK